MHPLCAVYQLGALSVSSYSRLTSPLETRDISSSLYSEHSNNNGNFKCYPLWSVYEVPGTVLRSLEQCLAHNAISLCYYCYSFAFLKMWIIPTVSSLVAQTIKNLPAMQETQVQSLGWEDPSEKKMTAHSSILAWRITWTEDPAGYSPWGRKELDTTEQLKLLLFIPTENWLKYIWTSFINVCKEDTSGWSAPRQGIEFG